MNKVKIANHTMIENTEDKSYLIFVDHRFSKMAEKAIKFVLPKCQLKPYELNNNSDFNTVFFKLEIKNTSDDIPKMIKKSASSFVDFVMPVDSIIDIGNSIKYEKIEDVIRKIIDNCGYASFKIEVKKVDHKLDETAKSIEVHLGGDLEKLGYKADLKTPKVMMYAILLNTSVVIGHVDTSMQKDYILDLFRQSSKEKIEKLNRAEFKIEEAAKFFDIDLSKCHIGLDIGAAPGGWTHYLSQKGVRMVAVDKALLNYKKMGDKKVLILADEIDTPKIKEIIKTENLANTISVESIVNESIDFKNYGIIHIKANMEPNDRLELLKKFGKFDLLTIDTNTSPLESTTIVNSLAELLNPEASLVMTAKLVTRNFNKHVSTVEAELSKNYKSIKLKKLPHNRREFTVHGVYKGNGK